MIELYQFPISKKANVPNFSPFCVKLELYLKATGAQFKIISEPDPRKAPRKKLPFIRLEDGTIIPDSEVIVQRLEKKYQLDSFLSEEQKAHCHAYKRMNEDFFAWNLLYSRWINEDNWPKTRSIFFKGLPKLVLPIIAKMVQKKTIQAAYAQGVLRYTKDEREMLMRKSLQSFSTLLNKKKYFFSDTNISTLDCSIFGVLVNIIHSGVNPDLKEIVDEYPDLVKWTNIMKETYFDKK